MSGFAAVPLQRATAFCGEYKLTKLTEVKATPVANVYI
jgi:hypothetical protein